MSEPLSRSINVWLLVATVMAASTTMLFFLVGNAESQETPPERANVVMFMTDDLTTTDLQHMPNVQSLLVHQGTTLENHTITLPTCCPSRVSYLRGQYPHNHKIGYGVTPGEQAFRNRGYGSSTVGTWANSEGYRTAWIGKYLNGFDNPRYTPPGWNRFYANVNRDVWSREFAADGRLKTLQKGNIDAHLGQQGEAFVRSDNETPMLLVQNSTPHTRILTARHRL